MLNLYRISASALVCYVYNVLMYVLLSKVDGNLNTISKHTIYIQTYKHTYYVPNIFNCLKEMLLFEIGITNYNLRNLVT